MIKKKDRGCEATRPINIKEVHPARNSLKSDKLYLMSSPCNHALSARVLLLLHLTTQSKETSTSFSRHETRTIINILKMLSESSEQASKQAGKEECKLPTLFATSIPHSPTHCDDTNSPPKSMPKPFPSVWPGVGGIRDESKFNLRLASFVTSGVLAAGPPGVFHPIWAGEGVTLR